MRERKEILKDLILYNRDLNSLSEELQHFDWDVETPFIDFSFNDLTIVLNKYHQGNITDEEIEDWANAIEVRDDINITPEKVKSIIFEIANPLLTSPNSKQKIKHFLDDINTISR